MKALEGLLVLDTSGPMGNYCGKLFADLGADVILIEPPEGTALRREPPFIDDIPGPDRSLAFLYANANKRSLVLDLDNSEADRETFRQLAAKANLVIETRRPGEMEALGLGVSTLQALNPALVVTSITPFGQTGPFAQYKAEDIVGMAMGGLLYLGGYPETAPITTYGDQAYAAANLYGATGSLMAVMAAEVTGQGDHVDVSMQESVVMALETAAQYFDLEGSVKKRWGGRQRHAGTGIFPCKDGYIYFMAGGVGGNRFWKLSCDWFEEEGVAGAEQFREEKWFDHDWLSTVEAKRIFAEVFTPFSQRFTMEELYRLGQAKHVPIAPVSTAADLLGNEQLAHRGFFVPMSHPARPEPFLVPGAPYKFERTPWELSRPAPELGQHNAEILKEFNLQTTCSSTQVKEAV